MLPKRSIFNITDRNNFQKVGEKYSFRHFSQRVCLLNFRSVDLGPACKDMWKNARNNLIVPRELNVDAVANTKQLFKVLPGKGAVKVRSAVFQRFRGI